MENIPSTASAATDPIAPPPDTPDPVPTTVDGQVAENGSDTQIPPETPPGAEPAEGPSTAAVPIDHPRRALKVILRLKPTDGTGYRALLAVGADGCDPLWRSLDADDLPAALDAIPGLLADAEEHWQHAHRYPAPTLPSRAKRREAAPGDPETSAPPAAGDTSSVPPAPRSPTKPVPVDQLALF